ncbi:L,D-transpeptidase [Bauldia sp.]|uniref:L,D-transpeptidase n=1 Tax=Bauldia sp. TaxID=2575872 RepID=UPI003BA94F21
MLDRRAFLLGLGAVAASSVPALAHHTGSNSKLAPKRVRYGGYSPGTLVVDPRNRRLYHVQNGGYATRYVVAVGRAGANFKGTAVIARKAKWPSWRPTDNMIRRAPRRYAKYRNGMPGGPNNPLGARALYLYKNGKDTYYRIHGTNEPRSIGRAVSNGCIRMLNEHVEQLYERVPVGAKVVVL